MRRAFTATVSLATLLALGCNKSDRQQKKTEGTPLVTVGEVTVTEEEVMANIPNVPGAAISDQQRQQILDDMVKTAAFYQMAKSESLDAEESMKVKLKWAQRLLLAQEYLNRKLAPRPVTDADVNSYIDEHRADFDREANYFVILLSQPSLGDTVVKLLKDGSYASQKVLQEFTQRGMVAASPTGYLNLGALPFNFPKEVAEQLMNTKINGVVGPLKLQGGDAVIQVSDMRKANPDFAQIGPALKQALSQVDEQAVVDSLFELAKTKVGVTWHEPEAAGETPAEGGGN